MKEYYRIHIGVVDDGINEHYYKGCVLKYNIEITDELAVLQRSNYDKTTESHGSICASVIHKYAPKALISSIKILNENRTAQKNKLIRAIEWCCNHRVDVINLSLGTIYPSDFSELQIAVMKAVKKGIIIIGACSNSGRQTYPAYMSKVIGVKCDVTNTLKEGEYCYHYYPNDGINITASSNMVITTMDGGQRTLEYANSYAAAFMTSKVCEILQNNQYYNFMDVNRELAANALYQEPSDYQFLNLKKEIDWGTYAVIFTFGKESYLINRMLVSILDIVQLETQSEDKTIQDILQYCNQNSVMDTIIIDVNGIESREIKYNANDLISNLSILNKHIIYLDDRGITNKLIPKLSNHNINIWHPSIVKHFNYPKSKNLELPIITIYDLTQKNLINTVYELKKLFEHDGYHIAPLVDQCIGKLYGLEYIPMTEDVLKSRRTEIIDFVESFYHPDLLLIGSTSLEKDSYQMICQFEVDICIIITDIFNLEHTRLIQSITGCTIVLLTSARIPEILLANKNIKVFDASILKKFSLLYQYIMGLYDDSENLSES